MSLENISDLCEICGAIEWENVINGIATAKVKETLKLRRMYKLDGIQGEEAAFVRERVRSIAELARSPPSCPMCRLWLRAYVRAYPQDDPAKDDQKSPWFTYFIPKSSYGVLWLGHPRGIDDDAQALETRRKMMNACRMRFRSYESQRGFERPLELACIDEDLAPGARSRGGRLLADDGCRDGLFKDWLHLCCTKHGDGCEDQLPMKALHGAGDRVKLRLLDVQQLKVVVRSFDTPYVALSYVWGSAKCFRAERNMFQRDPENASELFLDLEPFVQSTNASSEHWRSGSAASTGVIPRTILDAMKVTRALGQQYLWVDSICILNEPEELTSTVEAMDIIYKKALLTIVGAAGSDCMAGLPRAHARAPQITQISERVDGRTFIMAQPSLDFVLKSCAWSTRGWTFQESKLSRRKLIFTSSGVYFRCQKDTWAEDSIENLVLDSKFYPPERRQRTAYIARNKAEAKKEAAFADYTFDVRIYTARTLGGQGDALKAFAGLLSELQKTSLPTEFVWGLPQCYIDAALLWKAVEHWKYRKWAYQPTEHDQSQGSRASAAEGFTWSWHEDNQYEFSRLERRLDFPSWSWCGWQGAMGYFPRTVTESDLHLLGTIESLVLWPWLGDTQGDTDWKQDLSAGILTFQAWTAVIEFSKLPYGFATYTLREGWAGWPMDAEGPLLYGQHECILLSRQLREPVERVYYRAFQPVSASKLLNIMVIARDPTGLARRRGIGMMSEDIWWKFDPQFQKIRLQ